MERSCSLWRRREFWDHSVPPNTTRSTRLSLCGCDLTTSISSLRTSYGNKGESAQTDDLPRQPSKKYSTEADVSHIGRHVLEDSSGDGSRRPAEALPKKSHQRSQSTGCVLVRKAPTTPHTVRQPHRRLPTVRQQHHRPKTEGASKVDRDGDSGNSLRQSVSAQSTWSGCEVELGTCHCLPCYVHLVHTRVPMEGHRRRQRL